MKKLISVIAPMFNEELLVKEYCEATLNVLRTIDEYEHEILLVNDGSTDGTYEKMISIQQRYPDEIGVLCETRNFGLEGAVNAGLKATSGDIVVVMDADLQDPPELIPEMLNKIEGGADIVVGSRIKRSNDSLFKKISAGLYYRFMDSLSGKMKLEKSAANYRMMTRKAVDLLLTLPEVNGVFRVTVPYIGMKTATVGYDRNKRAAGKTKYHFKSMIGYAIDSITGISVVPLTKLIWLLPICFITFLIALICSIITSGIWKMGWVIIAAISVFSGLIIGSLAVIAIYVGEALIEAKRRPISMIYDYKPSTSAQKKTEGI